MPHHTTGMETPARQPNAFAAFVKDNYKFHRTPGVSHTDAMKELSKEIAKNKITCNNYKIVVACHSAQKPKFFTLSMGFDKFFFRLHKPILH